MNTHNSTPRYTGRFAPSPSGPLHLGSLYTALASYLIAKSQQGQWLVRIEDIDPPRAVQGASELIISSLSAHGLISDLPPTFQSDSTALYQQAINRLAAAHKTYPCNCNRKRLLTFNGFYDRHCIHTAPAPSDACAIRFKAPSQLPRFIDELQGEQQAVSAPPPLHNDFIIKRKDGLWAYQLAMVVDDIKAGVTHVVRGIDLLDNTAKQLALYQCLAAPAPNYTHIPVLCTKPGLKLSKQNHAPAINNFQAHENIVTCLKLLGQPPIPQANKLSIPELLKQASIFFRHEKIPPRTELII